MGGGHPDAGALTTAAGTAAGPEPVDRCLDQRSPTTVMMAPPAPTSTAAERPGSPAGRRFAGWGAAGGLLFSVLFAFVVTVTGSGALLDDLLFHDPLFAAAGAASAAGALALVRLGDDRELPAGVRPRQLEKRAH
jgi:hypothetical protein